uniref:Uncharacterized protein n=1 Tax=Nonomuraea gerenzanensis TaxID=93944 RepID=A0A1M4EGA9_9ACTN|nr:hypothetical protein BN4615_P7099 [Nonomuraea gerenzanensis]
MALLLCLLPLAVGCGVLLGPLRVDPGALDEIRAVGAVNGESEMKSDVGGRTEISNLLVVDVGAADSRGAIDKAVDLLQAREWVIEADLKPGWVLMRSERWAGTDLSIEPYDPRELHDVPDLRKALAGRTSTLERAVIIIVIGGG